MRGTLHLAWRYLRHHRGKTAILVASITLIVFLPAGLHVVVDRTATELAARARSTPLVVGRRGSSLELVLRTLYFESKTVPRSMRMAQVERVRESGLARAVPLHLRFRARGRPVVGTTLDYFALRGLRVAEGRRMAILGECVLGADAAAQLGLGPGDRVASDIANVFDLTGEYPLRMRVAGVLARTYAPDDDAVFVDIKTAWVLEGLVHGHRKPSGDEILEEKGRTRVTNASVYEFNEITPENLDTFHFHGDRSEFPVTAILAIPHDAKSRTLLLGRYLGRDEPCQIVDPGVVMQDLVETVVEIRSWVTAAVVLVGGATLLTTALVFLLSLRLRRRELETMRKIGCSRGTAAALVGSEILLVLFLGAAIAAALALAVHAYGPALVRELILQ